MRESRGDTDRMRSEKMQKGIFWAVLLSETGHLFCCVLPSVFSVLTLLSGIGISIMPLWLERFHAVLHAWEIPMIVTSTGILALGWGLYALSRRIDCHDTGCGHGPCEPKKQYTGKILWIATALFCMNLLVYLTIHGHAGE